MIPARCARCDPPQDHDDPETHAHQAGHPLCAVCGRSLRYEEAGACGRCIDRLVDNLTDVLSAYENLPDAIHATTGTGKVHPGGDALVLAGPGSEGRTGIRGARLRSGLWDDSHAFDELATDPPSVAQELASLENDWRRALGHPAALPPEHAQLRRPRAYLNGVVRAAVRYLQQHAEWCASTYPDGLAAAVDTVWQLRSRLHGVLADQTRPDRDVPCLPCLGRGLEVPVERAWEDPSVCRHERPDLSLRLRRADWRWETVRQRDARVVAWEAEHAGCVQGGRGAVWQCPRCGQTYDAEAFLARLRAGVEAHHAG